MPITELTFEQDLKMRQITDAINSPDCSRDDIITVFLALQRQCFVLSNNISQLVKTWPLHPNITPEDLLKFGTSSETNN